MTKEFSKDNFERKVIAWLLGKTHKQRRTYYRFISIISIMNLNRYAHINILKTFEDDKIRSIYTIFRPSLLISYFVNAKEDTHLLKTIMDADYIASDIADFAAKNTSNYATIVVQAYLIHAITLTYNTPASIPSIEDAAKSIANAVSTATNTYKNLFKKSDIVNILWSVIVEENTEYAVIQNYVDIIDKVLYQSIIDISVLLSLELDFIYDDLKNSIKCILIGDYKKVSQTRLREYCKRIDISSFISVKQLKETLFSETDSAQVRVLIVGSGGSGKTSLFQLLSGQVLEKNSVATTKISQNTVDDCTNKWQIQNPYLNKIDLSIWDFAGQTQYYGLHQSFFSNRCLYILVVDSRHQQSPYDWLQQIDMMSEGSSAHVIIVVNKYERCPSQINLYDIRYRFKNLNINNNSVIEVNLGDFLGTDIFNYQHLNDDVLEEYYRFEELLKVIVNKSREVQTQMSVKTLGFYNDIDRMVKKNKNFFSNRELKEIAATYGKNETYKELLKAFGVLIESRKDNKVIWLSAQWLNQAGYEMFHILQTEYSSRSYDYDEILDRLFDSSLIMKDESSFDTLLAHLFYCSLAVSKGLNDKIILPTILPVNDPEFLNDLNDFTKYSLYATFNIHVDFMQMGLFSQWIAEWLNHDKIFRDIEIKEEQYSRHCCILSLNNSFISEKEIYTNVYLLIKWHPHYRILSFSFYNPVKTPLGKDIDFIPSYNLLLQKALSTISSSEYAINTQHTNILGEKYPLSEEMTEKFLKELRAIERKGSIYHYFNQSNNKGVVHMTNANIGDTYNIQGNMDKAGRDITKAGRDININLNKNEEYLALLEELEKRYRIEKSYSSSDSDNITEVIEVAKHDIHAGGLNEVKRNAFDLILENLDKYNSVLAVASVLLGIYPLT